MSHDRVTLRLARATDVDFLAQIDLRVDDETGETYHHGWGAEQHAAHRERMAGFVHDDQGLAFIAEVPASIEVDPRVGILLASVRDLVREPPTPSTRSFIETLWPALPPGWAPEDGRFVEVFQLWVHADHRRRGIGSELKAHLHDVARRRGLGLVYTHTRATNPHVVALNEKLGYVAFRRGPLWDDAVRVCLAKRLGPAAPGHPR